MILELGQSLSSFEWIRITSEYSNAVLVAVLPYINDVAHKLDLPLSKPVTAAQVIHCNITPKRALSVEIGVEGNWYFAFNSGYVTTIQGPRDYFALQLPDEIPKYYGRLKTTKAEAIQLSRDALRKLGIPLEDVFAEQEPRVTEPEKFGTNVVPFYRIEWIDPRGGFSRVVIDIDGEAQALKRIRLLSKSLGRPPPKINVVPSALPNSPRWPECNPEYAWKLIPIALRAVDEYGQKLSLPIPRPLTTNHLVRFSLADNGGWPHSEIELTNGWRFIYRNSGVNGFYAPDNFFNSEDRPIRIKQFSGSWKMNEDAATQLVRSAIAKLGYATNLAQMDFKPKVQKPALPGIPRYSFLWHVETEDDLQSKVEAEVDAEDGTVKSLYVDHKAWWNKPPAIDIPITLPRHNSTNGATINKNTKVIPKPPSRPFRPVPSPETN
jgi:hypothetical protein